MFRIYETSENEEGTELTVRGRHVFYDLLYDAAPEYKPEKKQSAKTVLKECAEALLNQEHGFTFYTDITKKIRPEFVSKNMVEMLLEADSGLVALTGAELIRDDWRVYLVKKARKTQNRGVKLRYGNNLTGVSLTINDANVITRLCPTGTDKDGNLVYMGTGKSRYLDADNIKDYGQPRIKIWSVSGAKVGAKKDDGTEKTLEDVRTELKEAAQEELDNGCNLADVSLTVRFQDLGMTEEYAEYRGMQDIFLYDQVEIIHDPRYIDTTAQVKGYTYNCLTDQYDEIEIGDIGHINVGLTLTGANLASASVTGSKLGAGSVDTANLRALAVTTANIQNAAITAAKIQDAAIGTAKIENAAITSAKIGQGEIKAANIDDAAITTAKIEDLAVTKAKIKDFDTEVATIAKAEIGDAKIQTAQIENLDTAMATIAQTEIGKASIKAAQVEDFNAESAKIADAEIAKAEIQTAQIKNFSADVGSIADAHIKDASIEAAQITDLETETAKIADARIREASIDAAKITNLEANDFKAAIAKIADAQIGTADIEWGHIKTIDGDNVFAANIVGEKMYIPRLSVDSAQMVDITVGQLCVKAKDGNYYNLDVDVITGGVTATQATVSASEIAAGETSSGKHIIETDLTVTDLNAQTAMAAEALITKLTASRIDVDTLFAREAVISTLNTNLIQNNQYIKLTVGDEVETAMKDATPVLLRIDSSRGTVFKNNQVTTVLSVVLYYGEQRIETSSQMKTVFGNNAYLEWEWLRMDEERYGTISASDSRLSDNGFKFTLTPDDVDVKVTFRCNLHVD